MLKVKNFLLLGIIFTLISFQNGYALIPVESLVLGDFSADFGKELSDPLDKIFREKEELTVEELAQENKQILGLYRGLYQQGKNLENYCERKPVATYNSTLDKDQATRTYLATLQYIGLDILVRSIAAYARKLEFSEIEYENLTDYLIGNWCTRNLSIISTKNLRKNMILRFQQENQFALPTVKGNDQFPRKLQNAIESKRQIKQEFMLSIHAFESFCSWGNDTGNLRLLIPFIHNSQLASYVISNLSGRLMGWDAVDRRALLVRDNDQTVQVGCRNLICRKMPFNDFRNLVPRTVGSKSISDDFQRLWCDELKTRNETYRNQGPKILKRLKSQTFDQKNLMVAHMISLLTGIPDFVGKLTTYDEGKTVARSILDESLDDWADFQINNFKRDLYFEEPLTIELVNPVQYFKRDSRELRVAFDVNLGEYDRINQRKGKLKVVFKIQLSNRFLSYLQSNWNNILPGETKKERRNPKAFRNSVERTSG